MHLDLGMPSERVDLRLEFDWGDLDISFVNLVLR